VQVKVWNSFWKEHILGPGAAIYIVMIDIVLDVFSSVRDDARVIEYE
jgi:hypothetical protein